MKPTWFTVPNVAALLVRTGLGVVFLWASWDKIIHPLEFAKIIENYQILPPAFVNPMALVLPWIEGLCGLLLISGRLVPGAALTVDLLLLVFILTTGYNLYRGLDVNCGCFSVAPDAGGAATVNLVRNCLLLVAGIWLLVYTSHRTAPPNREPVESAGHHAD